MPTEMAVACKEHHDCGCDAAACCFDCPLPDCAYGTKRRPITVERYQRIRELRNEGLTSTEICRRLNVSIRQVWRAMSDYAH